MKPQQPRPPSTIKKRRSYTQKSLTSWVKHASTRKHSSDGLNNNGGAETSTSGPPCPPDIPSPTVNKAKTSKDDDDDDDAFFDDLSTDEERGLVSLLDSIESITSPPPHPPRIATPPTKASNPSAAAALKTPDTSPNTSFTNSLPTPSTTTSISTSRTLFPVGDGRKRKRENVSFQDAPPRKMQTPVTPGTPGAAGTAPRRQAHRPPSPNGTRRPPPDGDVPPGRTINSVTDIPKLHDVPVKVRTGVSKDLTQSAYQARDSAALEQENEKLRSEIDRLRKEIETQDRLLTTTRAALHRATMNG
ncbi:hypothetical protein GMORB2_6275 [Geosmithia morbida]|uniref:Uncharacterized protein n=1 Tax=Geosmithia morbida TaxID=1094350 RepID=A0A9P5D6J5_9HYPO|nr:uncharacterized protein GMORB2_6275 [Geosmithia morbida]KAF4123574.1 hypothetical protein GMORB2_6275 [Geosmithia morbida]